MFKMGCSMARRILDGKSSASGSASGGGVAAAGSPDNNNNNNGGSSSGSKKTKKEQNNNNNNPTSTTKQEEINDFSKLEEDPRLPLNVRQIFKITKSWKAIARTMSKTGTAMFLNLFEQNQDLFYLFERFQHLKGKQELHESMELREHAATVMSTLDQSINSLSDYDNFVAYLHSIGKLHRKVPGFKREHFWKIEQPFLKAVKQTLDERCNETIEEIYRIAIKLIIETIAEGYGEDRPDEGGALEAGSDYEGDRGNGNGGGGTNQKNSGSGMSPGDKSSGGGGHGGQSSDGSKQANNGSGGGGASEGKQRQQSSNMRSANGKAVAAAAAVSAATSNGQQQQHDTITSHSGENNQHKFDDKRTASSCSLPRSQLATATATESVEVSAAVACRETTMVAASKQDTRSSGGCPVTQWDRTADDSNQGQMVLATAAAAGDTNQCHHLHSDETRTTSTTSTKNNKEQDQKYNNDDDRYSYDESLVQQKEGELSEDRLKTTIICLRELLALAVKGVSDEAKVATSYSNGCERSKDIWRRQGDTQNKNSNKGTKSPETRSGGGTPFSKTGRQPNEWAALIGCLRANKRSSSSKSNTCEQKPKGARGGVGGGSVFGRILFVLVNRRRQFNELAARGNRREKSCASHLADDEQRRPSREEGVYLIESGLAVGSGGYAVVRRRKASCDDADVAAAVTAGSDQKGPAGSASYRNSSSSRAELMITSPRPRLADATIATGSSSNDTLHPHCVRRQANNNDDDGEQEERRSPRSIVRDGARIETNRHEKEDDFTRNSSRQLTTLLLDAIDDDDDVGARDRYSTTRPCNESNSPNREPADNNAASEPTAAEPAAKVAVVASVVANASSDMLRPLRHPRDQHNNDQQRNNLGGNERRGKISAGAATAASDDEDVRRQIATNDHDAGVGKVHPLSSVPSSRSGRFRINNKQPTKAMKWLTKSSSSSSIVTLLSRAAHKFNNARPSAGATSATTDTTRVAAATAVAADKDEAKVNENEDLVLRVNVSGTTTTTTTTSTATNSMECNHHSRRPLPPIGISQIHNNSTGSNNNINSCGQFVVERTKQSSQCPCLNDDHDDSESTITTIPISTMPEERKAERRERTKANKSASAIRLTSNAGDLGELIKMLMLTLLTTTRTSQSSSNNNNNDHQQRQPSGLSR